MGHHVRDVMTPNPVTLTSDSPVIEAAREMRDRGIGTVVVLKSDQEGICGIVTDRDICIRVTAEGKDPNTVRLEEICSKDPVTIDADASEDEAIRLMKERKVRRLPVVENERPAGIVSLGDLAVDRDRGSVLGEISAAPPNG
jgi:CBS domain-containing protein